MMENSYLKFESKCKTVADNLKRITDNAAEAAIKSNRNPNDITILAATKTVSSEIINYAIQSGINCIGENRVQELLSKYDAIDKTETDIHFIGHLQTNKVKQIVGKVSTIQSVDSIKLAEEISKHSLKNDIVTNLLVEVNIGREENKSGIYEEEIESFLYQISQLEAIKISGLMMIPPKTDKKLEKMAYFQKIHQISIDIKSKNIDNVNMNCLSIGMSNDYQEAITCGSTMIRVGRALFGDRLYV